MQSPDLGWGPASGEILSVGELLGRARALLEGAFAWVWVEGEVSNARIPGSGHAYFSLGDATAQVRAVCFRSTLRLLSLPPRDGLKVLARGRLTLYEARGDVQLVVEDLEPLGHGLQRLDLEQRKRRLAAEGLFDPARKRALPAMPQKIGVVTSESGAALADILKVLARRAPGVPVVVAPTRVQGQDAWREIVEALSLVYEEPGVEVVILGRGGGSPGDLSPFNEEQVVRAVSRSPVPLVSAVGHEVDVLLADFAADARASTPSAAAEMVAQEWSRWRERLDGAAVRLRSSAAGRLLTLRRDVGELEKRLRSPAARLDRQRIALDRAGERLLAAERRRLRVARGVLSRLSHSLTDVSPTTRLQILKSSVLRQEGRLHAAEARLATARRGRLEQLWGILRGLDPRSVLARGYSIARTADGALLRDAAECTPGEEIRVDLARGTVNAEVISVSSERSSERLPWTP